MEQGTFFPDFRGVLALGMPVGLSANIYTRSAVHAFTYVNARRKLAQNTHRFLTSVTEPAYQEFAATITECADAFDLMLYADYGGPAPGMRVHGVPVVYPWYTVMECGPARDVHDVCIPMDGTTAQREYYVRDLCYHSPCVFFELLMLRTLEACVLTNSPDPAAVGRAALIWHTNATCVLQWWPAHRRFASDALAAKLTALQTALYVPLFPVLPELLENNHLAMEHYCNYKLQRWHTHPGNGVPTPADFHVVGELRDAFHQLDVGASDARALAMYRLYGYTVDEDQAADDYGLNFNNMDMDFMHTLFEEADAAGSPGEAPAQESDDDVLMQGYETVRAQSLQDWLWSTVGAAWHGMGYLNGLLRFVGQKLALVAPPPAPRGSKPQVVLIRKIKETLAYWLRVHRVRVHPGTHPVGGTFVGACGVCVPRKNVTFVCHTIGEGIYRLLYQEERRLLLTLQETRAAELEYSTLLLLWCLFRLLYPWSTFGYKKFSVALREQLEFAQSVQFVSHPRALVGAHRAPTGPSHILGFLY